jgi:hypothetical protein
VPQRRAESTDEQGREVECGDEAPSLRQDQQIAVGHAEVVRDR